MNNSLLYKSFILFYILFYRKNADSHFSPYDLVCMIIVWPKYLCVCEYVCVCVCVFVCVCVSC